MIRTGIEPAVIETERLVLRPLQDSDAGMIALYAGDIRVAENLAVVPHPYPPGAAEAYIERSKDPKNDEIVWAIAKENELIGVISIFPKDNGRGNVGYWLAPQLWGAGFTPESLEAVIDFAKSNKFTGLDAAVHQGNHASARVLIKQGFEYCGDVDSHSVSRGGNIVSWQYRLDL